MSRLKGKKILVAGGGGFLGSHVCEALLKEGAQVTVLDIVPEQELSNLVHIKPRINILTGSVTDPGVVFRAMRGMDAVVDISFPAAGCDRAPANQHVAVGTVGVFNLLRAALSQGAYFVFVSSISVYGVQQYTPIDEMHPTAPFLLYGVTKMAGENYCRAMVEHYGCKGLVLRLSDLYGPRDGRKCAVVNFLNNVIKGEPLSIRGDGKQIRSYLFVADAAEAVVCALSNFKPGGVFNITGQDSISILQLAELAQRVGGRQVPVNFVPDSELDKRNYVIDGTLAGRELGFYPRVTMTAGLAHTLDWLKERAGLG